MRLATAVRISVQSNKANSAGTGGQEAEVRADDTQGVVHILASLKAKAKAVYGKPEPK